MGIRSVTFTKNEYYHVFNRGVDKRNIFQNQDDVFYFFHRMIDLNSEVNFGHKKKRDLQKNQKEMLDTKPLVIIVAYCLLPNHFHLILKEEQDNGISKFMQKLGTSYTKFFNKKYDRSGSLFQGKFRASHIKGNLALPTLSTYVNLNYKHHNLKPDNPLVKSSINEYLGNEKFEKICLFQEILEEVGGVDKYKKFLKETETIFILNKRKEVKNIDKINIFSFEELEN